MAKNFGVSEKKLWKNFWQQCPGRDNVAATAQLLRVAPDHNTVWLYYD